MKYLFQGLEILMKYWPESTDINMQNDAIWVGGDSGCMEQDDIDVMESLPHWYYDYDSDCWFFMP